MENELREAIVEAIIAFEDVGHREDQLHSAKMNFNETQRKVMHILGNKIDNDDDVDETVVFVADSGAYLVSFDFVDFEHVRIERVDAIVVDAKTKRF